MSVKDPAQIVAIRVFNRRNEGREHRHSLGLSIHPLMELIYGGIVGYTAHVQLADQTLEPLYKRPPFKVLSRSLARRDTAF